MKRLFDEVVQNDCWIAQLVSQGRRRESEVRSHIRSRESESQGSGGRRRESGGGSHRQEQGQEAERQEAGGRRRESGVEVWSYLQIVNS